MTSLNMSEALKKALTDFGDRVQSCRIDESKLPWCPMLPYVYPKYGSGKKIFYVGQDTFMWDLKMPGEDQGKCFDYFFKCYDANDFGPYLEHNSQALTLDCRVYGWPNKPGSFGFGINSLHLKLTMGRDPLSGLRGLSKDELNHLNGIGYGNLNSIELPETLQKGDNNFWPKISKAEYYCIKDNSIQALDKIKFILDSFRPDCIVIASWNGSSEDGYFKDCEVRRLEDEDSDLSYMKVQNYLVGHKEFGAKVFWTKHPGKWGWSWEKFSKSVNELADHIKRSMRW